MQTHEPYVAEQVLAVSVAYGTLPDDLDVHDARVGGEVFRFAIRPVAVA